MTDNQTTELTIIIEAFTALASAITWAVPNSTPAVESYLIDAWAAIDKLKGSCDLQDTELPYDELLRCLENDWNIRASWDGLRKFWCIELTEEGVRLRDAEQGIEINGDTSDGYHTFNELYHHRAVLFSVIVANYRDISWKSKLHHDGTMYDGMFIVGIDTPWGQASYHYDVDPYWNMFDCEEREAAPEWDGHTPDEAIERIGKLAGRAGMEFDNWFYLPKPKEPIVTNTETTYTWDGRKAKASVFYQVQEQVVANWAKVLDGHIIERICEVWKPEKTCNLIEDGDKLHCSNCGGGAAKNLWAYWHYCPNCGAKVVSE